MARWKLAQTDPVWPDNQKVKCGTEGLKMFFSLKLLQILLLSFIQFKVKKEIETAYFRQLTKWNSYLYNIRQFQLTEDFLMSALVWKKEFNGWKITSLDCQIHSA